VNNAPSFHAQWLLFSKTIDEKDRPNQQVREEKENRDQYPHQPFFLRIHARLPSGKAGT
jgi:hypothetical protein